MIRVQEPIAIVNFSAFTTNPSIKLYGWNSLKNTDLRVDHVRGIVLSKKMLTKFVKKENLSAVNNIDQGLKKLISGRTDVFIYLDTIINMSLNLPKFKNNNILNAGDLETIKVHLFLNKKYNALEPEFSTVIKAIKSEGLANQYLKEVFGVYSHRN